MSTIYVFTACGIYFKIIKHKKTSVDVFNTGLKAAKERIRAKEIPRMHYEETKRWEKRESKRQRGWKRQFNWSPRRERNGQRQYIRDEDW